MVGAGIGGLGRAVALVAAGAVMALSTVLVVSFAGTVGAAGSPIAAERIDLSAGGVPIRTVGSFGASAGSGPTLDPFLNSADGDRVVSAVLADLEDFWSSELSASGRPGLVPPAGGFVSMNGLDGSGSGSGPASGSGSASGALCITDPAQIAGNTFYCPAQDGIIFDSSALVPVLLGSYGSAGLATSFAHEFGHAVQARVGPTAAQRRADPDRYPAILVEAQADCAAGAFLAHASSDAGRVHVPTASLVRGVAPLLDFRDRSTVSPSDATAHGLGLDRLGFLLRGFRGGGMPCWAMTVDDLALTLGHPGVVPGGAPAAPRFASTAAAVDAASESVTAFAGGPAAAPDAADLDRSEPIGQFAAGTAVALATGRELSGTATGAACFTGAWVASVFGSGAAGELGSWPGDADEALDLIRARPGAGLDELAAYADGFHGGRAACG